MSQNIKDLSQAVFEAITSNRVSVLERLIQPLSAVEIDALSSPYAYSALTQASSLGCVECVQVLLNRGVNVNALDQNGTFALECAAWGEYVQVSEILLANGADPYQFDPVSKHNLDFIGEGHVVFDLLQQYRRMYDLKAHLLEVAQQASDKPSKPSTPKI